jgi:hypothetical protein
MPPQPLRCVGAFEPWGISNLQNTKIVVGAFVLDSLLTAEGSILDPSYELWE